MKNSHIGKTYITEDGRNRIKEYMLNGGSIKDNKKYKNANLFQKSPRKKLVFQILEKKEQKNLKKQKDKCY